MKSAIFLIIAVTFFFLLLHHSGKTQQHSFSKNAITNELVSVPLKQVIEVKQYSCWTSMSLTLTITRDCDTYMAEWITTSGESTMQFSSDTTIYSLSTKQLSLLQDFKAKFRQFFLHKRGCRNTTYVSFTTGGVETSFRFCGCGPDAYAALLKIFHLNKANGVHTEVSKTSATQYYLSCLT
ncbi:MAG TPA: hypothetical protein VGB71_07185 [Flavisolibacter sp.]